MTKSSDRKLLRGGTILAVDPQFDAEFVGDILIEGKKIVDVAPSISVDEASTEIIDAGGKILTPGFVDTHRHLWQSPFRYCGADWLIAHYAKAMWGLAGPIYTPEDLYLSLRIGLADALNAGVTQVFDWNHNVNSPDHADETYRAHLNSGARVVFGYGQSSPVWADMLDPDIGASGKMPSQDLERVRKQYYNSNDGLLTLAMAARGPEVSPMNVVRAESQMAKELGLRSSVHIGNGALAQVRPIELMEREGLLDETYTWIHCNTISDREIGLIAESGGHASVAPEIECHMGHGDPAISRLLDVGVRPSLSVDTCTNVSGDLFAIMRATLSSVRAEANRRILDTGEMPTEVALSASDVLEFATLQGARANGLGHVTGSLTPGKEADIVIVDTKSPNLLPVSYAMGSLVMGANPGNVDTVLVQGRVVKQDGKLVGLDINHLRNRAEEVRDSLFERIGAQKGLWFPDIGTPINNKNYDALNN
ncbi:MAG: amidohydrolase family protein [Parvularculaceae bacterium]|nr:amidohydrolase family protein [Parvularculaceae bacterium]